MKRLILALAVLAAGVAPGRAAVEFSGYLTVGSEIKFTLTDTETQKPSELLGIGGSAGGYTVTGFDAKTETLTVAKAGVTTRLPLKNARVVAGPAPAPATAVAAPAPRLDPAEREKKLAAEMLAKKKAVDEALAKQMARKAAADAERAARPR